VSAFPRQERMYRFAAWARVWSAGGQPYRHQAVLGRYTGPAGSTLPPV